MDHSHNPISIDNYIIYFRKNQKESGFLTGLLMQRDPGLKTDALKNDVQESIRPEQGQVAMGHRDLRAAGVDTLSPPNNCSLRADVFDQRMVKNIRHSFSKASFVAPQTGQTQLSGIASNGVPGAIPLSGSPVAGS